MNSRVVNRILLFVLVVPLREYLPFLTTNSKNYFFDLSPFLSTTGRTLHQHFTLAIWPLNMDALQNQPGNSNPENFEFLIFCITETLQQKLPGEPGVGA